jgi:hypothetical protein
VALTWLQGADYLSFNRTQSRVVIGLLTGRNTLRRHLYIMGLSYNPTCRKCVTEEETSVHILCGCEALASLRHTHVGSFFLEPEDIWKLSTGALASLRYTHLGSFFLEPEDIWKLNTGALASLRYTHQGSFFLDPEDVRKLSTGALASLRYTHLGSFFLDPEDIWKLSTGAICNFPKGTGLL